MLYTPARYRNRPKSSTIGCMRRLQGSRTVHDLEGIVLGRIAAEGRGTHISKGAFHCQIGPPPLRRRLRYVVRIACTGGLLNLPRPYFAPAIERVSSPEVRAEKAWKLLDCRTRRQTVRHISHAEVETNKSFHAELGIIATFKLMRPQDQGCP